MAETTKVEYERQSSYYDLLCQIVEPQQARHITRILTQLCQCDENSYPFLQGVLSATQLRLALTLPEAVVKKINEPLEKFHRTSTELLEALKHYEITSRTRLTKSVNESGWPFKRTYSGGVSRFLQNFVRRCEEKSAYRCRWLVVGFFVVIGLILVAQQWQFHVELSRVKQQYSDQYQALLSNDAEKLSVLDNQYKSSIDEQSNELAEKKFHDLEPRSYALAQQIEKSGRRVRCKSGIIAWEIVVSGSSDLPLPQITYDDKFDRIVTLYLPDTVGQIALSETSPSVSPSAKSKAK